MQLRAVAVREVAREAMGNQHSSSSTSGATSGATSDATTSEDVQALLGSLWRLSELQETAGLPGAATSTVERWRSAGGEEATAVERLQRLRATGLGPTNAGSAGGAAAEGARDGEAVVGASPTVPP